MPLHPGREIEVFDGPRACAFPMSRATRAPFARPRRARPGAGGTSSLPRRLRRHADPRIVRRARARRRSPSGRRARRMPVPRARRWDTGLAPWDGAAREPGGRAPERLAARSARRSSTRSGEPELVDQLLAAHHRAGHEQPRLRQQRQRRERRLQAVRLRLVAGEQQQRVAVRRALGRSELVRVDGVPQDLPRTRRRAEKLVRRLLAEFALVDDVRGGAAARRAAGRSAAPCRLPAHAG